MNCENTEVIKRGGSGRSRFERSWFKVLQPKEGRSIVEQGPPYLTLLIVYIGPRLSHTVTHMMFNIHRCDQSHHCHHGLQVRG